MEQWHCFVSNHLTGALPALGADMPVLASLEEARWEFVWEKAVLWRSKWFNYDLLILSLSFIQFLSWYFFERLKARILSSKATRELQPLPQLPQVVQKVAKEAAAKIITQELGNRRWKRKKRPYLAQKIFTRNGWKNIVNRWKRGSGNPLSIQVIEPKALGMLWKGCGILDHSQVFNSHQSNHSHLLAEPENAPLQDGRWLGPENLPQRPVAWVHVFFVFLDASIQAMPKSEVWKPMETNTMQYSIVYILNISPMQWISVTARLLAPWGPAVPPEAAKLRETFGRRVFRFSRQNS